MSENSVIDRLYALLPALHRRRDADQGYPLQALLRVITEQMLVVEDDIRGLYDNWFIETCADWAAPYLGELIGFRRVTEAGLTGDVARLRDRVRNRVLVPRREVARTVRLRRRKGTLSALEELSWDVADWPARAVEFRSLVAQTQAANHVLAHRGATVDLRRLHSLSLIGHGRLEPESGQRLEAAEAVHERLLAHGAFDSLAHSIDVRRVDSRRTPGRYNLPSIGLFVFRLKSYAMDRSPASALHYRQRFFTVAPLGHDFPLFIKSVPEQKATDIAGEMNLPLPLSRRALAGASGKHPSRRHYGEGKSLAIWTKDWAGHADENSPVPAKQVTVADLSDWEAYLPASGTLAVDPVLSRLVFPPRQVPRGGVWVSYHYGFSADVGGGPYERTVSAPDDALRYFIGEKAEFTSIRAAKADWEREQPPHAVFEIVDDRIYREPIVFALGEGQTLQLRAKGGHRPVIYLSNAEAAAIVSGKSRSRFMLDGLLVAGQSFNVEGDLAELTIRHSTLVPGLSLDHDCQPKRPAEPSLLLMKTKAAINIEHSIVGSIRVSQDEVSTDPIAIRLTDSILDAARLTGEALGSDGSSLAHAVLNIERSTVIGNVEVHAIDLGENTIFLGHVLVGRRQRGCLRFCYVEPGGCPPSDPPRPAHELSRTPKRFRCQPDLALQKVLAEVERNLSDQEDWGGISPTERERRRGEATNQAREMDILRVRPILSAQRYGLPTYCQLAASCAEEIKRGADDQSEMGVFHDLYEPQRRAILDVRLDEYTPADGDAGIIFAT